MIMDSTLSNQPFADRYLVVDEFMPDADAAAMRAAIEAHFANPARHLPATHMVWNYWYVPGLYTYCAPSPTRCSAPTWRARSTTASPRGRGRRWA